MVIHTKHRECVPKERHSTTTTDRWSRVSGWLMETVDIQNDDMVMMIQ